MLLLTSWELNFFFQNSYFPLAWKIVINNAYRHLIVVLWNICSSSLYEKLEANHFQIFCPEAVADANRAIELDPLMSKAFLRKG